MAETYDQKLNQLAERVHEAYTLARAMDAMRPNVSTSSLAHWLSGANELATSLWRINNEKNRESGVRREGIVRGERKPDNPRV